MLGINYVSSDEEDDTPVARPELPKTSLPAAEPVLKPTVISVKEESKPTTLPKDPPQGPSATPLFGKDEPADDAPPGSPYTSNRIIIQNLTLPTVPNLNIPPSPPGSPPQKATKKFAQFLELKNKGQHFNKRLESSSVVRDPNHLSKLMDFADITNEEQYASALPEGLNVPAVWPEWAYGDALNASQKKITKAKENERSKAPRGSVDFVPARSGSTSGMSTPAGKASRQSATERMMAGSDQRPKDKR